MFSTGQFKRLNQYFPVYALTQLINWYLMPVNIGKTRRRWTRV